MDRIRTQLCQTFDCNTGAKKNFFFQKNKNKKEWGKGPGAAFTTLYFLPNLQMSPISYSISPWRAFSGQCNKTLLAIVTITKLRRK
jgi:hypothetical protein